MDKERSRELQIAAGKPRYRKPKLWEDPDEFGEAVDAYFLELEEKATESGLAPRPTLSGLALQLGFNSVSALRTYGKHPDFRPHYLRGRLRVMHGYETALYSSNATGPKFALSSMFGLVERSRTEHTSPDGSMTPRTVTLKALEASDSDDGES